jgi:hypothetical protein
MPSFCFTSFIVMGTVPAGGAAFVVSAGAASAARERRRQEQRGQAQGLHVGILLARFIHALVAGCRREKRTTMRRARLDAPGRGVARSGC